MRFDVLTLFPEMFSSLNSSITGRAQKQGIINLHCHNLRDYAGNSHGSIDDTAFGGEPGMVIRPEPLEAAITDICGETPTHIVFCTPQGAPFTQDRAKKLSKRGKILIICGHYKGIDDRIRQMYVNEELSIGDYVLTGGELPAMVIIDAVSRLLPGAISDRASLETDSFYKSQRLGWPVYTRPEVFKGQAVPPVLLSGNHKKIEEWRLEASLQRTRQNRPDLLTKHQSTP